MGALARRYPSMDVWGGCCGTGGVHLDEIARNLVVASPGGGGPVRAVAGLRPGGPDTVLRAAPPRGRHDQVGPRPDHRRRHRLVLPERARAEGVTARSG